MNRKIYRLSKEQFNVNDLDFADDDSVYTDIFNKAVVDPLHVYNNIIHNKHVNEYEIKQLNNPVYTSVVLVEMLKLVTVVHFYSRNYPEDSMNWLDVSRVPYMIEMFEGLKYNGDISKWNVSNVTDMKHMFKDSEFNQDISEWNVSNVTNMEDMFY